MKRKAPFIFVGYGNDRVFSIQILKSNFTFRMPGGLFQIDLKVKYCTISCLVTRSCVLISFLKYVHAHSLPYPPGIARTFECQKKKGLSGGKGGPQILEKKKKKTVSMSIHDIQCFNLSIQSQFRYSKYFNSHIIRGTQRQFSENIRSEDDLRSRIFGTFS